MKKLVGALVLGALILSGCGNTLTPDSSSNLKFNSDSTLPTDTNIYEVTGMVVADVQSLTRQVSPAGGSVTGVNGYVGGSFWGEQLKGKGMVRLLVETSTYPPVEGRSIALLKVEDTKAVALLPGDIVTFKCRAQAENVSAIVPDEKFDANTMVVWELDYCRLTSAVVKVSK